MLQQRIALLEIKEGALAAPASSVSEQEAREDAAMSADSLKRSIEENKAQVERSILYLQRNSEEIRSKASVDPLSELLHLGKTELAVAYDKLIVALEDREKAIEERLKKSIAQYGIKERILMQGKDFLKELEDVPNVGLEHSLVEISDEFKPENIISVGQQVSDMLSSKHMSADEKVFHLLNQTLNPFN